MSHFRIIPFVSVSIKTDFISDSINLVYFSMSDAFDATYKVLPGKTPSKSGDAIFKPAAASTLSTGLNLSRGSLISSSGFGNKTALGFITITESLFATTILSPFLMEPSIKMILAVSPNPTSSFTSRTIPRGSFCS